jgi:hypothetical protein
MITQIINKSSSISLGSIITIVEILFNIPAKVVEVVIIVFKERELCLNTLSLRQHMRLSHNKLCGLSSIF